MTFTPKKTCNTPGCGKPTDKGGYCSGCEARRQLNKRQEQGARERGYAPGWDAEFIRYFPLCAHAVPKKCTIGSELADHYPRSRKQLKADGVPEEQLNDWQYLVPACTACHRYVTSQLQPGGWNRKGYER